MNAPSENLRLPPHSIEAEQLVLGGLLIDCRAWDRVADILADTDFYQEAHRRIYRTIAGLCEAGKPADVVTVGEALGSDVELVGGHAFLAALFANVASVANIRRHAEIVKEKAVLRKLAEAGQALADDCMSGRPGDPAEIARRVEATIAEALDVTAGEPSSIADAMQEAMERMDAREGRQALRTGFRDLDAMIGGMEPGNLIVIAGRPSIGKTAIGLTVAHNVAKGGKAVAFFSLEMTRSEVAERLISARTGISGSAMRAGGLSQSDWKAISDARAAANGMRLMVDEKPAIGVGYVRAKARRIKRQGGLDLIVIDYLQLMKGQGDNRVQEVGSVSRGLKALAKDLQVPVIALAQLNRGVESRPDKRPIMSDLRDSGEIEQDADIVAMIHREGYYQPTAPEWDGIAELLVRKNRNGSVGDALLSWWPAECRFADFHGQNPRATIRRRNEGHTGNGFGD